MNQRQFDAILSVWRAIGMTSRALRIVEAVGVPGDWTGPAARAASLASEIDDMLFKVMVENDDGADK